MRTKIEIGFVYLAARAGWRPLLACLAGFMLARILVARRLRPRGPPPAGLAP